MNKEKLNESLKFVLLTIMLIMAIAAAVFIVINLYIGVKALGDNNLDYQALYEETQQNLIIQEAYVNGTIAGYNTALQQFLNCQTLTVPLGNNQTGQLVAAHCVGQGQR